VNEELLLAISSCHRNLAGLASLNYLSEEYVQMIDMVFLPLLESAGKDGASPSVNSMERNALVSFFIDLLDRLGKERDLRPEKRLGLENATDKFERHVISFLCAAGKGEGGAEGVFKEFPSYLDAMRLMLRRQSRGITELRETELGGAGKYPVLEGIIRKLREDERVTETLAEKRRYFDERHQERPLDYRRGNG